jgi:hypothetical protein
MSITYAITACQSSAGQAYMRYRTIHDRNNLTTTKYLPLPTLSWTIKVKLTAPTIALGCVTGSSPESTTNTWACSTDASIHLSQARRDEPDSLGADLVVPTICRDNNTSPTHVTNRYKDPKVPYNLTQDLDNLTQRT